MTRRTLGRRRVVAGGRFTWHDHASVYYRDSVVCYCGAVRFDGTTSGVCRYDPPRTFCAACRGLYGMRPCLAGLAVAGLLRHGRAGTVGQVCWMSDLTLE